MDYVHVFDMKKTLQILLLSLIANLINAQITVDFEDTVLGDTSFMAGGVEWKMTGDFIISEFENFSCVGKYFAHI